MADPREIERLAEARVDRVRLWAVVARMRESYGHGRALSGPEIDEWTRAEVNFARAEEAERRALSRLRAADEGGAP